MPVPRRSFRRVATALCVLLVLAACAAPTAPKTAAAPTTPGVPVLGTSRLTAAQILNFYNAKAQPGYDATVPIATMANYYVSEGAAEGVRGDLAFAQALVETGWFRMSTSPTAMVPNTYNNFAGMGACDSCAHGMQFATALLGVRGQIQHLKNFADPNSRAATLAHPPVSPLYGVNSHGISTFDTYFRKGKAPTWNQMGGLAPDGYYNWASAPNYAEVVLSVYDNMLTYSGLSGECPPDGLNFAVTQPECPASIQAPGRAIAQNMSGGYYVLSGDGTVKAYAGATNYGSARYASDIARSISVMPDGKGYAVMDGNGKVTLYGSAIAALTPLVAQLPQPIWPGWDIARSLAITPTGKGFVILDGYGVTHAVGDAPNVTGPSYGFDIARSVVVRYDNKGYWVLYGTGLIATLRTPGVPAGPDPVVGLPTYSGDVARSLVVLQSSFFGIGGAYEIDANGGVHGTAGLKPVVLSNAAAADRWRGIDFNLGRSTLFALKNDGTVTSVNTSS
jgi:hypothetical protein